MIITVDMLVAVGIFVLVVTISRYVSLGSIVGAISVPLTLVVRENLFDAGIPGYNMLLPFVIFLAMLVIFTHRKNVIRLLNGNESKVSFKKKTKSFQ